MYVFFNITHTKNLFIGRKKSLIYQISKFFYDKKDLFLTFVLKPQTGEDMFAINKRKDYYP